MSGKKLSEAQLQKLAIIQDNWMDYPFYGDCRPIGPLIRAGMIEERKTDVTPASWGSGPVRSIRHELRRTPAGRSALTAAEGREDE